MTRQAALAGVFLLLAACGSRVESEAEEEARALNRAAEMLDAETGGAPPANETMPAE